MSPAGPRLALTAAADDVLARRERYELDHPDVSISPPETHASLWIARRGGRILASHYQLAGLLDALDWFTGSQG